MTEIHIINVINRWSFLNEIGALIDVFRAISQNGENILAVTGVSDWSWVARNSWPHEGDGGMEISESRDNM